MFQQVALEHAPSYQIQGALTDGFDSTVSSMRTLFPRARLGFCFAMPSTSCRTSWSVSRPRCAGGCAPSSTPCCTGVDREKG
jgi:hypothetical protein